MYKKLVALLLALLITGMPIAAVAAESTDLPETTETPLGSAPLPDSIEEPDTDSEVDPDDPNGLPKKILPPRR